MYAVGHYNNKVHGQSGSTVPKSPGSGILVPCRHSWIFVAAQVWHGMSQALVLGHSSEQLAWQEQLEPVSSGLPVLQVQQMWTACVVQVGVMQVVLLRSSVLLEPAVWQLCHLGQCQLLWHCIHKGVSMHSSMWNHCWCILDSCSMEDAYHSSRNPNLLEGVICCNWLTSIQWCKCFAAFVSLWFSSFRVCVDLLMDLWGWWVAVEYLGWNGCSESALVQ